MSALLLVEDDMDFASTLAVGLRSKGFDVIRTSSGEGAIEAATRDHPSLILLDLGLPKLGGMAVLDQVRSWSSVPIIVISARHDEPSKVLALEHGADDYVTKPIGIAELAARINAALRRGVRADGKQVIDAGSLRIDLGSKSVTRDGLDVHLTTTEWLLLESLASTDGGVLTHSELLRAVWGPNSETSVEYLRVYIAALRRKLEHSTSEPKHIVTQSGVGYRFIR